MGSAGAGQGPSALKSAPPAAEDDPAAALRAFLEDRPARARRRAQEGASRKPPARGSGRRSRSGASTPPMRPSTGACAGGRTNRQANKQLKAELFTLDPKRFFDPVLAPWRRLQWVLTMRRPREGEPVAFRHRNAWLQPRNYRLAGIKSPGDDSPCPHRGRL